MIYLKKVIEKEDLRKFVMFPFELYKNSKFWVPPIINQEMDSFNEDLNPNLRFVSNELLNALVNSSNDWESMGVMRSNDYDISLSLIHI